MSVYPSTCSESFKMHFCSELQYLTRETVTVTGLPPRVRSDLYNDQFLTLEIYIGCVLNTNIVPTILNQYVLHTVPPTRY